MRVYLDICSIQRPLDDQRQLRIHVETEAILGILALCEKGEIELLSSAAHDIETEQNPYPDRRAHVLDVLSLAAVYVPVSPTVAERVKKYVSAKLGRLDALHLSLAVEGGALYFCTTDDKLHKRGQRVDTKSTLIVSPLELIAHLGQR